MPAQRGLFYASNNQVKRPAWWVRVNEPNDLNLMPHLRVIRLGRTEGLTVVTGLVETANVLLAGCEHLAGITDAFCAGLELLG